MYNATHLVLKSLPGSDYIVHKALHFCGWLGVPRYVSQEFKGEAYQLQIEMERLNHQAGLLLKKVTEEADRCAIQEPVSELKMLWDNLDEKIISRQVRRGLHEEGTLSRKWNIATWK